MGSQQNILLILAIMIIGIAISISYSIVTSYSIQVDKDEMLNEIRAIAADAYQYKSREKEIGGGSNSYYLYNPLPEMINTTNAKYQVSTSNKSVLLSYVMILGISKRDTANKIYVEVNMEGILRNFSYSGDFQ